MSLLHLNGSATTAAPPRLIVAARPDGGMVEMEFLAAVEDENIEDRLGYLDQQDEAPNKTEIPLRLLRHYASSVRHRKYHGIDIITVHVEGGG